MTLAANLAARVSSLAPPGAVVVSDAVESLVRNTFELEALQPAAVKGVEELIAHHRVIGERLEPAKEKNRPLVGRQNQLARVRKAWAKAQNAALTTPGMLFVGEPGIGKSRLAAEAAELVESSGGVALELAGSAFRPARDSTRYGRCWTPMRYRPPHRPVDAAETTEGRGGGQGTGSGERGAAGTRSGHRTRSRL